MGVGAASGAAQARQARRDRGSVVPGGKRHARTAEEPLDRESVCRGSDRQPHAGAALPVGSRSELSADGQGELLARCGGRSSGHPGAPVPRRIGSTCVGARGAKLAAGAPRRSGHVPRVRSPRWHPGHPAPGAAAARYLRRRRSKRGCTGRRVVSPPPRRRARAMGVAGGPGALGRYGVPGRRVLRKPGAAQLRRDAAASGRLTCACAGPAFVVRGRRR